MYYFLLKILVFAKDMLASARLGGGPWGWGIYFLGLGVCGCLPTCRGGVFWGVMVELDIFFLFNASCRLFGASSGGVCSGWVYSLWGRPWRILFSGGLSKVLWAGRARHLPGFILLVSSSDTLLVVSILDKVYDCHLRPLLQS